MTAKECPNCRLLSPGTASFCSCGYDFEAGAMRAPRAPQRPRPSPPTEEPLNPYAPAAAPRRSESASLPVRVFAMPFVPSLWARAAGWRFVQVLVPVTLLAVFLNAGLALYRGWGMRGALANLARSYSESYPAVIVEGGKVRVDGDGVIHFVEGKHTFLVDPKETIALDQITTPEYIVVREEKLIRRQSFRTEVTDIGDLQEIFGDPIRIDGPAIRAFDARWGGAIQVGVWAFIICFGLLADVFAFVYVLAAAGLVLALRGRATGRTFAQCLRVTFAIYSLVLVLSVALNLLGKSPGFCIGIWLWPLLLTGLGAWSVGRRDA